MNLTGLLAAIEDDADVKELLAPAVPASTYQQYWPVGMRPAVLALAGQKYPDQFQLVITATSREAEELAQVLRYFGGEDSALSGPTAVNAAAPSTAAGGQISAGQAALNPKSDQAAVAGASATKKAKNLLVASPVAVFPPWETLPHERLSPRPDTMARRTAVLRRLVHPQPGSAHAGPIRTLIAPVRAVLQPIVAGLADITPVTALPGSNVELLGLAEALLRLGYKRVDMVERRGELAVRGGLLDVFPPNEPHPLRLEFFGNDVEEIRYFSLADQRTIAPAPHGLWATPAREVLLDAKVRQRAQDLKGSLQGASALLEQIAGGTYVEGLESLTPALVDDMTNLLALLPGNTTVICLDPEKVTRRASDLVATTAEFLDAAWSAAAAGASIPLQAGKASFLPWEDTKDQALLAGMNWWDITSFAQGVQEANAKEITPYRSDLGAAIKDMKNLIRGNWQVVVTTDGPGSARRLVELFMENELPARLVNTGEELAGGSVDPVVQVGISPARRGFRLEKQRLAFITEADLTGRAGVTQQATGKLAAKRKGILDPLALRAGDYVVHEQHGIGRFIELLKRTTGTGDRAVTREYLVLEYAPSRRGQSGDRLFVPTSSLDQVTKYSGAESPALHKMGGADWAKTRAKARAAVREIAAELIRLYAARAATKGHAYSPDTPWQQELEEAFPYVETPDQLVTIDEVKADMEKPMPMDRLLCGDVGYGKTEVAVRAAFKAVQDNKQVAVLAPTTLLVNQHLDTFSTRYAPFGVQVRALSRFVSAKEAEQTKADIHAGKVDVVIGTHALLTGSVHFKDLGLVIIDEEQRFGVEHKETLKQLRTDVDVLSMSATPIPRTLEMAVSGIREMSNLATPPEERHPVLTYVGAYEAKQVSAAIRREMLREGQVFYVHNRVNSITGVAARIKELVPEARVSVAHGKMSESQLEKVMLDFWNHDCDVLVCTTIIETGLDISNANTLIVDRADAMGLSQLHQLRGRVGRGRERAYAYFFYPSAEDLTPTAHERLQTIAANSELGSGMQVAMRDLEIRGAGNLLGGEQSGHIAGVGFDMYIRMVAEAVAVFRGEVGTKPPEVQMDLAVDAHIPPEYIEHERGRLEFYAKISAATRAADLAGIQAELEDRFGPLPAPVQRLFHVARLREKAREFGITDIGHQTKYLRLSPVLLADSKQMRLARMYKGAVVKAATRAILVPIPTESAKLGAKQLQDEALLEWVEGLLKALFSS